MRLLIALMICCCTLTYAQDVGSEATEAEVTVADEGDCDEVAVVESLHSGKGGCGCGKPKI
ncbi:MAG TPA: hypothetical protein VLE95_08490 [Chlamydiales bacterium]|nr:hypothetical protein [Chlamydiales bacterium]